MCVSKYIVYVYSKDKIISSNEDLYWLSWHCNKIADNVSSLNNSRFKKHMLQNGKPSDLSAFLDGC